MKNFKSAAIILLLAAILSATGAAQATRESAGSRNRVADAAGGYSFAVPEGWTSKEGDGGFALVNREQTVIVGVKAHRYNDFRAFMADSDLAADGLRQIGEARKLSENAVYVRAARETERGLLVIDTVVMFSPHGGGVAIVSLTDAQNAATGLRAGIDVAGTVLFSRPAALPASNEWQTLLRGKQLIYLYTGNGYSERRDIWLCPSGSFYLTFDGSSLSNLGSGVINSQNRGTWRATGAAGGGAQLILRFQDGQTRYYELSRRPSAGEIALDGARYFIKPHNQCD